MSKILFISNVSDKITSFATASISAAHGMGMEYHHASNWSGASREQIESDEAEYGLTIHNVGIARSPFSPSNIKAYKEIKELIKREGIDFIHCNTPVGGLIGRLAGKRCGVKKVIYQAHGFHFYKGAPKLNWMLYYPVEKWLARYTDALITINKEDYELAGSKLTLRGGGKVYYVPGVGIDKSAYKTDADTRAAKREELGIPQNAFVIISAGELNANKNNRAIISAMKRAERKDVHYVLCGVGDMEVHLQKQAEELSLSDRVHFIGYRKDIKELYKMSDCFVMPSYREGLSRSMMEAMASGLPCIASKIRGNTDLLEEGGGFLCEADDIEAYAQKIDLLAGDSLMRAAMGKKNLEVIEKFSTENVTQAMLKIYEAELK